MSMTSRSRTDADVRTTDRSLAKTLATIVGATFLLVGIAGFIPGITTDTDQMEFAGPDSMSKLFGLFQVSVLHNLVHFSYGVIGLLAAYYGGKAARTYLIGGGIVYLVLMVYGLLVDKDSDANFVPMNNADNWLHLGLGLGMIALGLIATRAITDRTGDPTDRIAGNRAGY